MAQFHTSGRLLKLPFNMTLRAANACHVSWGLELHKQTYICECSQKEKMSIQTFTSSSSSSSNMRSIIGPSSNNITSLTFGWIDCDAEAARTGGGGAWMPVRHRWLWVISTCMHVHWHTRAQSSLLYVAMCCVCGVGDNPPTTTTTFPPCGTRRSSSSRGCICCCWAATVSEWVMGLRGKEAFFFQFLLFLFSFLSQTVHNRCMSLNIDTCVVDITPLYSWEDVFLCLLLHLSKYK